MRNIRVHGVQIRKRAADYCVCAMWLKRAGMHHVLLFLELDRNVR